MRAILCAILLLAAPSARAELFEMSGTLSCSSPSATGKLAHTRYSTREIIAEAIAGDTEIARRFALVYDGAASRITFVRRCDGLEYELFAVDASLRTSNGEPKNDKMSYAFTQLLDITDWSGSVEDGSLTCSLTGNADANSAVLLTAKGKCSGALTYFAGAYMYCTLQAKVGKVLKIANDCPT
jgi:hypothetical protein